MKRFSREYATHVVARVRREIQRILPASLQTLPQGFAAYTSDVIDSAHIVPVDPWHTISRRPPNTIDAVVDWEFTTRLAFPAPGTFVATIAWGSALDHAVLTRKGILLADMSIEPGVVPENAQDHSVLRLRAIPRLERFNDSIVVLSAFGGDDNYFHWMFDVLPRIGILARSGTAPGNARVLVNGAGHAYQRETLAALGVAGTLDARRHRYLTARTLIVPSLPGIMGEVTRASCDFLRSTFLGPAATGGGKRLYVSRAGARYRRLLNEVEVVAALRALGFDVIDCATMTVRQQAETFASASVVVAPHGAGLTNIVFCAAGTQVIELFSPAYVNGCYWGVANHIGADYWYLLGEGERPGQDATHAGAADDYRVDISALMALLERAEAR